MTMASPEQVLHDIFGYSAFRLQQKAIVDAACQGQDVLALMPTGGGKSLCYQVPALCLQGLTVVVSPLIALMQDQVATLQQAGVAAAFINSSQSIDEQRLIANDMQQGKLKLLYVAPERLLQPRFLQFLQSLSVALIAVDEAHCVSQWGHDFRSDYLGLAQLKTLFPNVPLMALTATADKHTRQDIIERLQINGPSFIASFDRPNIEYRIGQKTNPRQQLLQFIESEHRGDCGIVYCLSRKKVEATAEFLQEKGINALAYHAGLPNELRSHHLKRFLYEDGIVMVATVAFGMGIDKPDVRFVAHLDLPKSLEAYYQETGRAGRDGLPSTAWMVYGLQDVITLRQMLEQSSGDANFKRIEQFKLNAMLGFCEITSCRRHALLLYFDEQSNERCGNCDSCLNPAEQFDATTVSQMAMSCVFRTGQRFGVSYLIDVLRGKDDVRIKQFGHDKQSTFAIGVKTDEKTWRSIFRQLIARGFFTVDISGFGALHLHEKSRAVLKGEQQVFLRKDTTHKKPAKASKKQRHFATDAEKSLWEALRQCRKELAEENGVPPFMVFNDATLMDMMARHPTSEAEMLAVSGVGEAKLERFGTAFLQVLEKNTETQESGYDAQTVQAQEVFALFMAGFSVANIAKEQKISEFVTYKFLAQSIAKGDISVSDVVELSVSEIGKIQEAIMQHSEYLETGRNSQVVLEALAGLCNAGQLYCVRQTILP